MPGGAASAEASGLELSESLCVQVAQQRMGSSLDNRGRLFCNNNKYIIIKNQYENKLELAYFTFHHLLSLSLSLLICYWAKRFI